MEQQKIWIEDELAQQGEHKEYETLPSLKFTPNVITEVVIDFSKPFETWSGEQNKKPITKKIIPVTVGGSRMNWWLNTKNPVYRELLQLGKSGQTTVKILQTGTQDNTKYVIVK